MELDLETKRKNINDALLFAANQTKIADEYFTNFSYKDAHNLYIQSIETYMNLIQDTKDDANF